MDYSTLSANLDAALNRTDLTARYPQFIARVEDAVNARLSRDPVRPMGAVATSTTTVPSVAVPTDFIDMIDLTAANSTDSWKVLRLNAADQSDWYATRSLPYRENYDSTLPRHYSIVGSTITLSATPATSLTLTMKYWQRIPALTASATTNWLSNAHGDIYELGALAYAYKHLRDDQGYKDHLDLFVAALENVVGAYPETSIPGELRSDLPYTSPRWSILNG